MKSKLLRLQESLGDNEQLVEQFVRTFENIPDSEENAPETDLMVERFCEENEIELKEEYDISSLNLKKGTVLELSDLEDVLNLTKGKNRKELSLYYNDGGIVSVKVLKDGQNTVNGIVVDVTAHDGESKLANAPSILKSIKDGLENGDLSYLVEEEEETATEPLEKMSLAEMLDGLTEQEYKLVEAHIPTGRKKKLIESIGNILKTGDDAIKESEEIEELVAPFYSIDIPEGMERTTQVTNETVSKLIESRKMKALNPKKGIYILKESTGEVSGLYNANTEELDTVVESEFDKDVDTILTESSEKVRVPKGESKKFNDTLKKSGVDFSHSSTPNVTFDDFYINDMKKDEVKKLVKDYMSNGGRAVLVERMKENEETPKKEYSDVILENENGEVLLLKRNADDTLEPSKLGFAGGKIEESETPEDAAIRELKEETGVDVDSVEKVAEYANPDGSTSHYFKAKLPEGQQVILSEEHEDLKWVEPAAMMEEEDIIFENNDRYSELCETSSRLQEGDLAKMFKTLTPETEKWAENELKNGKPEGVLNRVADKVASELGFLSPDGKKVLDQKGYNKVVGEVFRIGFGKNKHLKENEDISLGGTVEDKDGNSWKVTGIDDSGFQLSGDSGEKTVAFDKVDELLKESTQLTESKKVVMSVRKLKESVSEDEAVNMIENSELDKMVEESYDVDQDGVNVDSLIPLGESTDEFGDTVELSKDADGGLFVVEKTEE